MQYLTNMHLGLNNFHEDEIMHSCLDFLNPIYSCGFDTETTC